MTRKRTIKNPLDLLRLILFYLSGNKSLIDVSQFALMSGIGKISDVGFMKRFVKCKDWIIWLTHHILPNPVIQYKKSEWLKPYQVLAVDASDLVEKGAVKKLWHLHYALDIFSLTCCQFKITQQSTGESLKNFKRTKGCLVIADRAYTYLFYIKLVHMVEIPKPNGKTRPLGIPTIVDRIVQQCILQVLEPICEAKFHERSNGFRPNRSTEHAIVQCCRLMQIQHLHYAVDIDIQGFFDNVNHGKLISQMWEMGIRDKKLLCIVRQMLKAQVVLPDGTRITPTKGTPQGGILSPLLSNIVLNELDWWVTSQWEEMPTHYEYKTRQNARGTDIKSHTYRALRRSSLKEMYIVRYADDFKIFCRSRQDAEKAFEATRLWLKDRLGLEISPEKSKVINLKQRYSEFLGFKMKVYPKGKKYVVCSHISDKAIKQAKEKISTAIRAIQNPADDRAQYIAIQQYNSVVAGLHNYYRLATHISVDFPKLSYGLKLQMANRLRELTSKGKLERGFIKERYGKSKQLRFLNGHPLIPMGYVQTRNAQHKKKTVNRYTSEGRAEIHKNLGINTDTMIWLMQNPVLDKMIEFADNRISLFAAQYGRCAVTGADLMPYDIRCHHKVPLENGGTDEYGNLVLVIEAVHILIHATLEETIQKYLKELQLNKKQLEKLNKLRKLAGTSVIA